jgi:putative phosphoribosyl transferase
MFFQNREQAGRALAARLGAYRNSGTVVLALPRGGVPVGREIATALGAPLDLVLVRKIGAPSQPELAIGAISDGEQPDLVLNERIVGILDVEPGYLEREKTRALAEIDRRRRLYLGGRTPVALEGRTAILVDDGLATGMTALAALRGVRRRHPRRIVLAVPVASPEIVEMLRPEADEIVCLQVSDELMSVGEAYLDFRQLTDEEVVALLRAGEGPAPERP